MESQQPPTEHQAPKQPATAPASDASPSAGSGASGTNAAQSSESKGRGPRNRGKRNAPRHSGGPRGRRRIDERPPRFDVNELFTLAGLKPGTDVVTGTLADTTDAALFFAAKVGDADVRIAVDPKEFSGTPPEAGAAKPLRVMGPAASGEGAQAGSVVQAMQLTALDKVKAALDEKAPLTGTIVGEVKGGFAVALFGEDKDGGAGVLRAFLPRRHGFHPRLHAVKDPVGEVDEFDVTEFEPERANIVLTRKKRLEKRYKDIVKSAWTDLEVGKTVKGTVRSIVAYGAFIDVGGVDGLLHISDLAWNRPPRISSVLREGQVVETQVLVADKKSGKLKLGLKQLIANPWQDIRGSMVVGADVEGDVVSITDYGAFVRVADGVEGLVHMSEVTWSRIKHVSQKLNIGDRITARILDVDYDEQRLSLSMRALEPSPYAQVAEKYPAGTVIRVQVKSLTDFGVFVQLDDNVDGLVHIGEISWTERIEHPSEVLSIGQEVEAVVLNVDVKRQRVSCSIKQLLENPWKELEKKYARETRHNLEVIKVIDAGAYLKVDAPLTAFCGKRDLTDEPVSRAQDAVKVGQVIEVKVRQMDRRAQKISVSARAIIEGDTKAAYDEYRKSEGSEARLTLADQIGHLSLDGAPAPSNDEADDDKPATKLDAGALGGDAVKKVNVDDEPASPVQGAMLDAATKKVDADEEE